MARITWDETQNRFYETGVQRGVFYGYNPVSKKYDDYAAWNGLSKVTESPDGGDESAIYADNQKYLSLTSAEVLKGTIEAYTYPKKFESYDGTVGYVDSTQTNNTDNNPGVLVGQQARKKFGMVYTTLIGDADTDASIDNNYLIHVIYGAKVSPSEREYETINDNPDAITFSWKFTTTPESISGSNYSNLKPTASLVFDTRYMSKATIKKIEDTLYGSSGASDVAPILPSPSELLTIAGIGATASTGH